MIDAELFRGFLMNNQADEIKALVRNI
jgi:hypothetical protein